MRVLFVVESLSLSQNTGVSSTAISLARSLNHSAIAELSSPTLPSDLEDTKRGLNGLTSHLFPQSPVLPCTVAPKLAQFLANELSRFDIVHVRGLWRCPQWIATRKAQRFNISYVVSPHGLCEPFGLARKGWKKKLYFNLIEKQTFQKSAAIHAITDAESSHSAQVGSAKKIEVIPHRVDVHPTLPLVLVNLSLPPEMSLIPKQSPVLLFMGHLRPKKGLDLLIPAFAQVLKAYPSAYLVLTEPDAIAGLFHSKFQRFMRSRGWVILGFKDFVLQWLKLRELVA